MPTKCCPTAIHDTEGIFLSNDGGLLEALRIMDQSAFLFNKNILLWAAWSLRRALSSWPKHSVCDFTRHCKAKTVNCKRSKLLCLIPSSCVRLGKMYHPIASSS